MNAEHVKDALKLVPTVTVSVTSMTNLIHWDTLSYILASIYTFLMICNFAWLKILKPWIQRKSDDKTSDYDVQP